MVVLPAPIQYMKAETLELTKALWILRAQVRPSPVEPLLYQARVAGPVRSAHSVCPGFVRGGSWTKRVRVNDVGKILNMLKTSR